MGCLLGCFGLSSKRKRRKLPRRLLPRDHGFGLYQQLDSSLVFTYSDSDQRNLKETVNNSKIRKKVRFNLNVKAYEPLPSDSFWEGDDADKEEDDKANIERGKTLQPSSFPTDIASSYPSNYRYQNCSYNYDQQDDEEAEEYSYDDSDLDSDEDYLYEEEEEAEDDQHNDIEELRRRRRRRGTEEEEQISQHFSSLKVNPDSGIDSKEEGRSRWAEITNNHHNNAREKNQYIHSVLNPVQNLAQWKQVKAKSKQQPEKWQMKENADVQLLQKHTMLPVQQLAVDSSLANWLLSPATCQTKSGFHESCGAGSCPRREETLGITEISST
ncbi:hypothetical protein LINGRAHAP2_LOCUS23321 [Linum grandiflorum]